MIQLLSRQQKEILAYLEIALVKEDEDSALQGIIITAQELLNKKLGLKEFRYGEVTGSYKEAKNKAIDTLGKY